MTTDDVLRTDPPEMVDGDLRVVLVGREPGDPEKGWVPWYRFELRVDGREGSAGHVHLRVGDVPHVVNEAGHVGYSVVPECRGHRYAARAARMVVEFAHAIGIDPVWITSNPDNVASLRTLEIMGATRVDEVDVTPGTDMYERGEHRKVRFRMDGRPR